MGRLYSVQVSSLSTPGAPATVPGGLPTIAGVSNAITWTSVPNGVFDPNALLVEFDFLSFNNAESGTDGATITIHGVGFSNITQAQKFTGRNVQVRAGMSGGLPLEDPTQAGIILSGQIVQAWANWVGTEMDLNFLVFPSKNNYRTPGQFVVNWLAGTPLQAALTVTLKTAFPGLTPIFNLSQPYILGRNVVHTCRTLQELAPLIKSTTASPGFAGVNVSTPINNTIVVSDNLNVTGQAQPKQIKYTDLIGQPTWIGSASMMVTTVMRADIQVGSLLIMPFGPGGPGQVTLTNVGVNPGQLQPSNINYATAFQGQFSVTAVRHVGNSRDTGPTAWVSIFECAPTKLTAIPSTNSIPGGFTG
jgi:hypothetical protein